jgi:hypothetical protein
VGKMIKLVYINSHLIEKKGKEIIKEDDLLISDSYVEIENTLTLSQFKKKDRLDTRKLEKFKKKYPNIVIISPNQVSMFDTDLLEISDKIILYISGETDTDYEVHLNYIKNNLGELKKFEEKIEYERGE